MKKLIAEAAGAAAVVLTLIATPTARDVQPMAQVEPPITTVGLSAGTSGLVYDAEVGPSQKIKIVGQLPKQFARAQAQLSLNQAGARRRLASSRVSRNGRFVLSTAAPSAAGSYAYQVTAKVGRRWVSKSFSIRVTAPPRQIATPTSVIITPTPTPTPTPTDVSEPGLTPGPIGGLGDPSDWTYILDSKPRWDPCTAITWSVAGPAPYAGHVTDLTNAFALMAEKTGLTFTHVASPAASTFDVIWSTEAESPGLTGPVLGLGGPASIVRTESAGARTIAGRVILDAAEALAPGYASAHGTWGKVMVHEIGHAIGLGHARGDEQIMFPAITEQWELGSGDVSGLRALGASQGCFPEDPREAEYLDSNGTQERGVLMR